MTDLPAGSKQNSYIKPFDRDHWLYIFIMAASLSALLLGRQRISANPDPLRWLLLGIQLFQQILLYGSYIRSRAPAAVSLPFHLSRLNSILCLIWLITGAEWSMDILFYWGLFAYVTFLLPTEVYAVTHPIGLSFVLNHTLTILIPWFAIIASSWRPTIGGLHLALAAFVVYLIFAAWLNPRVDGNYFYLVRRPLRRFDMMPLPTYMILNILVTCGVFWIGYGLSRLILS